jgi:hypothetical protein
MGLTALDLGLRGAASGLFLMMVLVLLRLRPTNRHIILGMALAAGGAAYAVATAPFIPTSLLRWTLPILSALPVIFWLWARATFDDDFILKRWHGALWLAVVGIGFSVSFAWTSWPALATSGAKTLSVVALVLALSAAVQTVKTWRADLVARRRRLRMAVLVMSLVFIALDSGSSLTSVPIASRTARPAACRPAQVHREARQRRLLRAGDLDYDFRGNRPFALMAISGCSHRI